MIIKKSAICFLIILIVSGCVTQPTYKVNDDVEQEELSSSESLIEDKGSNEVLPEEKETESYLLYTIDLSLPPADREWQTESIQADVETMTISDVMWALRGEQSFEDLPVVAEVLDNYTINITDPSFMGDYYFLVDACVTYTQGLGRYINISNADPQITILYEGEAAQDLVQFPNGALVIPYYESDTGIWLPSELRELQNYIQKPIISEQPFEETLEMFEGEHFQSILEQNYPQAIEYQEAMDYLSEEQKDAIRELCKPSDDIKHDIQGYLTAVLPPYLLMENVTFSDPSQAPDTFIIGSALRYAPQYSWSRNNHDELPEIMRPYVDVLQTVNSGWFSADTETAASEIFGDQVAFTNASLPHKQAGFLPYSHFYSPGYGGGGAVLYPIVLEYSDKGDRYEVTAAVCFYEFLADYWCLERFEEALMPYNIVDAIDDEAARFTATLMKDDELGFKLYAFYYEGSSE